MIIHIVDFFQIFFSIFFSVLLIRLEAELEYLKIAQDLDMYGVNYFDITVKWVWLSEILTTKYITCRLRAYRCTWLSLTLLE